MGANYERPIHTRRLKSCAIFIRRNGGEVNTISSRSKEASLFCQVTCLQTLHFWTIFLFVRNHFAPLK